MKERSNGRLIHEDAQNYVSVSHAGMVLVNLQSILSEWRLRILHGHAA